MNLKLEELTARSYIKCDNESERDIILDFLNRSEYKTNMINDDELPVIIRVVPSDKTAALLFVQVEAGDNYTASQFIDTPSLADTTTNENDINTHSMNA